MWCGGVNGGSVLKSGVVPRCWFLNVYILIRTDQMYAGNIITYSNHSIIILPDKRSHNTMNSSASSTRYWLCGVILSKFLLSPTEFLCPLLSHSHVCGIMFLQKVLQMWSGTAVGA